MGQGCWTFYRAHGGGATPGPPWSAHQTCRPWQPALHPTQETERRGGERVLLTLFDLYTQCKPLHTASAYCKQPKTSMELETRHTINLIWFLFKLLWRHVCHYIKLLAGLRHGRHSWQCSTMAEGRTITHASFYFTTLQYTLLVAWYMLGNKKSKVMELEYVYCVPVA